MEFLRAIPGAIRKATISASLVRGFVGAEPMNCFVIRCNRVSREWRRHLREQSIDRAGRRHAMRDFVSDQRFAKKFAHPSIALSRAKIVVV